MVTSSLASLAYRCITGTTREKRKCAARRGVTKQKNGLVTARLSHLPSSSYTSQQLSRTRNGSWCLRKIEHKLFVLIHYKSKLGGLKASHCHTEWGLHFCSLYL